MKNKKNKKKLWIIFGAIVLILIIAGIVIGVSVGNSKVKELTQEDYEFICTYYQTEATKCAFDVQERTDLTTTEEISDAILICMGVIYSKLESDYGIQENEVLPILGNQCVDIMKDNAELLFVGLE